MCIIIRVEVEWDTICKKGFTGEISIHYGSISKLHISYGDTLR